MSLNRPDARYVFCGFTVKGALLLMGMLLIILASGCSNHSTKRAYLDSSTDLNGFKNPSQPGSTNPSKKASQQACSNRYKVASGDSLSEISVRCNIRFSTLAKANNLKRPYTIRIGQTLVIPDGAPSNLSAYNKSASVANTYKPPTNAEIKKSYKKANWQWPMEQQLEHRFIRDSAGITALEINAFPGMAVLAVADGEVVYSGNGIMQFGLMVMLKHASGHMSVYAHNSQIQVKEGQNVKAGQRIASSGATGLTDRPKIYIEARYKGNKVDIKRLFD